jgi:hypothetical protein
MSLNSLLRLTTRLRDGQPRNKVSLPGKAGHLCAHYLELSCTTHTHTHSLSLSHTHTHTEPPTQWQPEGISRSLNGRGVEVNYLNLEQSETNSFTFPVLCVRHITCHRNVFLIRELNSVSRHNSPTTLDSPPAKVDFWHLPPDQTFVVTIVGRLTAGGRPLPACITTKYNNRQSLRYNTLCYISGEINLCIVLPVLSSHCWWMDFKTIYTEMFAMYVHKVFAFIWNEKLFAESGTFEHAHRAQIVVLFAWQQALYFHFNLSKAPAFFSLSRITHFLSSIPSLQQVRT